MEFFNLMFTEVLTICISVYLLLLFLNVRFFQSKNFRSSIKLIQPRDKKGTSGENKRVNFILDNSLVGEKIRIIYGECKRTMTIDEILKEGRKGRSPLWASHQPK